MGAGMNAARQTVSVTRGIQLSVKNMPMKCSQKFAMVRCGNCRHFSPRCAGHELASLGYGRCALAREHGRGRILSARLARQCAGYTCAA